MNTVPPGNESGTYYIPLAGLPWQCSWQRLKDFARNQQPDGSSIYIEHAMVYNGPGTSGTSGWVRVKGIDNFKQALAHLNGGIMDGSRALLADGRNEMYSMNLAEDVTTPPRQHLGGSAARDTYQSAPAVTSPSFSEYHQPNPIRPTGAASTDWYYHSHLTNSTYSPSSMNSSYSYSNTAYYQQGTPMVEQPNLYSAAASMSSAPSIVYAGSMTPSPPVYIPSPQPVITYVVPLPYAESSMSPQSLPITQQEHSPAPAVIKTEARKIIIRSLPHNTTTNELHDLLIKLLTKSRSSTGDPHQSLQDVEIARYSDQKSRGHAFAVFDTHQVAKDIVIALEGLKFQNRVLSSRLAKEGAEPAKRGAEGHVVQNPAAAGPVQRYPLMPGPSTNSHREKGSRSGRRKKDEGTASSDRHRSSKYEKDDEERRHGAKSCDRSKGRSDSFETPVVVSSSGKEHR